jgi:hypothetical protein
MEGHSGSFSSTQTSTRDQRPLSRAPNSLRWSGIKIEDILLQIKPIELQSITIDILSFPPELIQINPSISLSP